MKQLNWPIKQKLTTNHILGAKKIYNNKMCADSHFARKRRQAAMRVSNNVCKTKFQFSIDLEFVGKLDK